MNINEIPIAEVSWAQIKNRDDIGKVFYYHDEVYRAIYPDKEDLVKDMFRCGLIEELVEANLFPNSKFTEYSVGNFQLVIKHDTIHPIVYPQEWTFSMLQNAALVVLKVATIARKFGYNMKDCHSLNILFDGINPKYVDLGSFYPDSSETTGWKPYLEFLRCYYYPLFIWSEGNDYIGKMLIFSGNLMATYDFYTYKYRLLKKLPATLINKLIKLRHATYQVTVSDRMRSTLSNTKLPIVSFIINALIKRSDSLNRKNLDLKRLADLVSNIDRHSNTTIWSDYHKNLTLKRERFKAIIQQINKYCPNVKECIDIAGNKGLFSELLISQTNISKVICQDLDQNAIDMGFLEKCAINDRKSQLVYVHYNAFSPLLKLGQPLPSQRFQSDLVVCLALLHHLLLTQGYSLEFVLDELAKYTSKYIVVEFMPKGLWLRGSDVNKPSWYNVEWFEASFVERFILLKKEQIDENYILYVGHLK